MIVSSLAHQARYDLLIFRRNPAAVFFAVAVPLVMFVVFGLLLSAANDDPIGPAFTASMATFAVFGATFVSLAMNMTIRRERGLLKRVRATPLPAWTFIASQAIVGLVVSSLMLVAMILIGLVLVDLRPDPAGLAAVAATTVIGVGAFSALGLALSGLVPSEEAAPSMVQGVAIPLYLVSGIFLPLSVMPDWVAAIARVLPLHHFARAIESGLVGEGLGPLWGHWVVVAGWGAAAFAWVTQNFPWTPRQ